MSEEQRTLNILDLPEVALEKILSYISYEELAQKRLVCRTFNEICGGLLTKGFIQLEKKHAALYRVIKGLLPRRPSERRTHLVVSRYSEILQGMETRIRMMSVTYMRYVEQHYIYFIPGKVLDEIQRLLNLIDQKFNPPNNNNTLLEELRDLSSMAMEHFDEHILPIIQRQEKAPFLDNNPSSTCNSPKGLLCNEILQMKRRNRAQNHHIVYWAGRVHNLNSKVSLQNLRLKRMTAKIREQNSKLQVQSTKIANHELMISTLQKQMETMQQNYLEMKTKMETEINSTPAPPKPVELEPKPAVTHTPLMLSKTFAKLMHYDKTRQKSGLPSTFTHRKTKKVRKEPESTGYVQNLSYLQNVKRRNENMHSLIKSQMEYQKMQRQRLVSKYLDKISRLDEEPKVTETVSTSTSDLSLLDMSAAIRKRKSLLSEDVPTKVSREEPIYSDIRELLKDMDGSTVNRKRKSECDEGGPAKNPALFKSIGNCP